MFDIKAIDTDTPSHLHLTLDQCNHGIGQLQDHAVEVTKSIQLLSPQCGFKPVGDNINRAVKPRDMSLSSLHYFYVDAMN